MAHKEMWEFVITDNNLLCNRYFRHERNSLVPNQEVANSESISNMSHATIGQQLIDKIWKKRQFFVSFILKFVIQKCVK